MIPVFAAALAAPDIPDPLRQPEEPLLTGKQLKRCRKKGWLPDTLVEGRIVRTPDAITLGGREIASAEALQRVLRRTRKEIRLIEDAGCVLPIREDPVLVLDVDGSLSFGDVLAVVPIGFDLELPVDREVPAPPAERPESSHFVLIHGAGVRIVPEEGDPIDLGCDGTCSEAALPWSALASWRQDHADSLFVVSGHPATPWSTVHRALEVLAPAPVAITGTSNDGEPAPTWTGTPGRRDGALLRLLPPIDADDPDAMLLGSLPREAIDTTIRKRMEAVRTCYLPHAEEASGKVVIAFQIGPDGTVVSSKPKLDHVGHGVAECVNGVFEAMLFPEPDPEGNVLVSYPFLFSPE